MFNHVFIQQQAGWTYFQQISDLNHIFIDTQICVKFIDRCFLFTQKLCQPFSMRSFFFLIQCLEIPFILGFHQWINMCHSGDPGMSVLAVFLDLANSTNLPFGSIWWWLAKPWKSSLNGGLGNTSRKIDHDFIHDFQLERSTHFWWGNELEFSLTKINSYVELPGGIH